MKTALKMESLSLSYGLLQPSRPIFCTTKNADGTDHVAPFSWIMPISCSPPRVAFAVQNQRGSKISQTLINILRDREFVVNIPRMGQEKTLVEASFNLVSHACKFDRTGYTREDSVRVKPKRIAECAAALECAVYETVDGGGDHTLLLADVVYAVFDAALYDENCCPNVPDLRPLINLKECRFDDHQEHLFLDTSVAYRVEAYYEKPDPRLMRKKEV